MSPDRVLREIWILNIKDDFRSICLYVKLTLNERKSLFATPPWYKSVVWLEKRFNVNILSLVCHSWLRYFHYRTPKTQMIYSEETRHGAFWSVSTREGFSMSSVCFVIITSKFQLPIDTLLTFLWKTKEKWGKQVCVHFTWLNVSFAGPSIAVTAFFISLMARSLRFTFANDLNLNVWSTIWRAKWVLFIRDRTQGSSLQWCPFYRRL